MCGIVGKLSLVGKPIEEATVRKMADAIRHRGPDADGYLCRGPIGLGFRRLSIIDLSPAGNQPMSNEDGTVWIVFNGEIYNFQELRPDLERRGHRFRSHTDTECIVHLYEEYGEGCLEHLRGMFAFAIWDEKKQKLLLARDRIGKKPLKYYQDDKMLVFGSELKSFIDQPGVPREVDWRAIDHYLTYQYVPHPMTGFRGIQKLPPAHYLSVDVSGAKPEVRLERYWRLDYSKKLRLSEAEWQERILHELDESVKIRMISDVPLGAFLSGGVDSSAVVALMAKHSSQPVKTFSIGFTEQAFNELGYAKMVAERYGTNHREFMVEPHAIDVLPKLVYHYEEPYADSSALPTYLLSELTRQHVTVALNGDGGDENFAGYPWYRILRTANRYQRWPKTFRSLIAAGASLVARASGTKLFHYGSIFATGALRSNADLHAELMSYFTAYERRRMYTERFEQQTAAWDCTAWIRQFHDQAGTSDPVDQALYVDILTYLADDLVVKVDIASMAVSLEARSPFLDHRLMELAASMPSDLKLRGRESKYILKKLCESILPRELLYRKKHGFSVPIDTWFKGSLRTYAREILLDPGAFNRQFIQPESIQALLDAHDSRGWFGRKIWALLTLELWHRSFFAKQTQTRTL